MAFSALHLAAWNWTFPSTVEKSLWRSAALTATIACGPMAILLPLMENIPKKRQHYVVYGFLYPLAALYLVSRITLMCQIFLCFRAMPNDVYKSIQWTTFLLRAN